MSKHRHHWRAEQHVADKIEQWEVHDVSPIDLAHEIVQSVRQRSDATLRHENNRLRARTQHLVSRYAHDNVELSKARSTIRANDASLRLAGDEIRALHAQLNRVHALREQARAVSAGPRAVIYVADLEAALGISGAPAPSKLGQNGQADPTEPIPSILLAPDWEIVMCARHAQPGCTICLPTDGITIT